MARFAIVYEEDAPITADANRLTTGFRHPGWKNSSFLHSTLIPYTNKLLLTFARAVQFPEASERGLIACQRLKKERPAYNAGRSWMAG